MIIIPSFVFMVNIEISDLGWMFLDAAEWKRQTTKASAGTCHRRDRNGTSSCDLRLHHRLTKGTLEDLTSLSGPAFLCRLPTSWYYRIITWERLRT